MKSLTLGSIEVINPNGMGKMSFNRGRKIIKMEYGGKPWRFPSIKKMQYLTTLYNMGIGGFISENSISTNYWTNHGWIHGSDAFVYNIKNGITMNSSRTSAMGYLIIVRSI